MGFYQDQIVPLMINLSMRQKNLVAYRNRIVPGGIDRKHCGVNGEHSPENHPAFARRTPLDAQWLILPLPVKSLRGASACVYETFWVRFWARRAAAP
jgi:hypothetical protein